ncbi:divergent protein kinase domain 2A isoform X1 [Dendroctonus ponderosae]|uniref:divergent protein kinase domain 2A isoform X1 n=1 Tax=Dendroctonus ponderosae TaxID=77166 RepID=UPI002035846E|nr:divergent protein kinase domain 2A isoform X1 [Dendroctonus ponderosae]
MSRLWWLVPFGACLLAVILTGNKTLLDISERSSCPFCYGDDFCSALENATFQYNSLQKVAFNFVSVKNVFFAQLDGRELVLKKLADCAVFSLLNQDVFREAKPKAIKQEDLVTLLSDNRRHFHTCNRATAQQLIQAIPSKNSKELANLWTLLNVNVEPLLLEVFRKEHKWPVPHFFGYCGRLAVEENCGVPLNEVQLLHWNHRAHIALQLLQAADKFTSGHEEFRLYLTDVSPDNVAVNLQDFSVAFVDLEHGILQGIHSDQPATLAHYTQYMPEEEFAFFSDSVCASRISDHNIYAVCRLFLSPAAPWPMMLGGLLHSPQAAPERLFSLIELCVHSPNEIPRFSLSRTIQQLLRDLLNDAGYYNLKNE